MYAGLSFLNSPRGYLGTDTGGKVATLEVMTERGRFDPDLGYWAERWDPEGTLHPIVFTAHTASGKWVNVTTLPALWAGWQLYRLGGYRAALLVPMAGAVGAAFAARALLRRLGSSERHAWHGFWLVGLASPVAVYALDLWEHALGLALMAWAMVLLADLLPASRVRTARNPARSHSKSGGDGVVALGAGLLFGAAATMRTEALVYLAVAGAAWGFVSLARRVPVTRVAALGLVLVAAAAVPLVANEALERTVVGSTIRAARVTGTATLAADAPGSRVEEAAITVAGLEGNDAGIVLGAAFVALVAFAASRKDPGLALAAVAGAAALAAVRFVSGGPGFVPGLGPAWVLPAAAVSVSGSARARSRSDAAQNPDARPLLLAVALGAMPVVLATQFRGGAAPQWAGRYLLLSGLLLAVLGWAALERRPPALRVGLAALAVAVTAFGVVWLQVRSHDVARTIAAIEAGPEPVVVSGVFHLAREGGATYGDKRWLTLSPTAGPDAAATVLDQAGVDRFLSVQTAGSRPLRFPGYTAAAASDLRLFDGVDLRITPWKKGP